jgi:hypothetical protein
MILLMIALISSERLSQVLEDLGRRMKIALLLSQLKAAEKTFQVQLRQIVIKSPSRSEDNVGTWSRRGDPNVKSRDDQVALRIAIPSHGRAEWCGALLGLLRKERKIAQLDEKNGCRRKHVIVSTTVFVNDNFEKEKYAAHFAKCGLSGISEFRATKKKQTWYKGLNIVATGTKGIGPTRAYINKYYFKLLRSCCGMNPRNEARHVLCLDDDFLGIDFISLNSKCVISRYKASVLDAVDDCFRSIDEKNIFYGGVQAGEIQHTLRRVLENHGPVQCGLASIEQGFLCLKIPESKLALKKTCVYDFEEYSQMEQTLRQFLNFGAVVRRNDYVYRHHPPQSPGGLQSSMGSRTVATVECEALAFVRRFGRFARVFSRHCREFGQPIAYIRFTNMSVANAAREALVGNSEGRALLQETLQARGWKSHHKTRQENAGN